MNTLYWAGVELHPTNEQVDALLAKKEIELCDERHAHPVSWGRVYHPAGPIEDRHNPVRTPTDDRFDHIVRWLYG
jgi:hypothetical protein